MKKCATDKLGRIVIPIGFRKELKIEEGTPLYMTLEGDKIVLRPAHLFCQLCGASLARANPLPICENCIEQIKAL